MKYVVLGSGAMGIRFGILLKKAGYPVDFVDMWKPQIDAIRKQHGVYVTRNEKNKHIEPMKIYTPEEYHGNPDVVLIEPKQMQLDEMLKRCAHFFNKHQYAVTLMNGMGHYAKIDKYFPKQHVIGGTAIVCSRLIKAGFDDFVGDSGAGSINLANQTEKPDATTHEIVKEFKDANCNPNLTTNFMGMVMAKLILNSVLNTMCTGFKCTISQYIASPAAKPISIDLINEAFDICERAGIKLLTTREQEWKIIYRASKYTAPNHYPSMCQDLFKHRSTEVHYINGYIYRLGLKYHYVAHTHKFAEELVHLAETLNNQQPKVSKPNDKVHYYLYKLVDAIGK